MSYRLIILFAIILMIGQLTLGHAKAATVSEADLANASVLVSKGYQAMQASNQDPSKSVEAAFAFAEAQPIYVAAGDFERVRELNANIFWCRKRMSHTDLERYLAGRGGSGSTLLDTIERVVNAPVAAEEADRWLQDADLFALEHPDQTMRIMARYFEVAERFVGSPAAIAAQRKSLDYQAKVVTSGRKAARETLFTRPVQVPAGRQALPDAKDLRNAMSTVKKSFREGYADRTPAGKRALARQMFDMAQRTKDDVLTRCALFDLANDLASDIKDVDFLLTIAEARAAAFTVDPGEAKKAALQRIRMDSVAKAVLVLLDEPGDPTANAVAGRYYALELRNWETGFAMLSISNDTELARLAEMELMKPEGVQQELEVADGWYALGGPKNTESVNAWNRAMHWYERVLPRTDGITKRRVEDRMEELFGTVFPSKMNWNNLTIQQWDRLKPIASVVVASTSAKVDTKVTLRTGQRVRVVPCPTDTWTARFIGIPNNLGYRGWRTPSGGPFLFAGSPFPICSLLMWVDETKPALAGVITGPGPLVLANSHPQSGKDGQIRVKILVVDD